MVLPTGSGPLATGTSDADGGTGTDDGGISRRQQRNIGQVQRRTDRFDDGADGGVSAPQRRNIGQLQRQAPGGTGQFQTDQDQPPDSAQGDAPGETIGTAVEESGLVSTEVPGSSTQIQQQASEFEQSLMADRPGLDTSQVDINVTQVGGEYRFTPEFTEQYRRERAARRYGRALGDTPISRDLSPGQRRAVKSAAEFDAPGTNVTPGDIELTDDGPRLTTQARREAAAGQVSGVGPSGVELVGGQPQLTQEARSELVSQAEARAERQATQDLQAQTGRGVIGGVVGTFFSPTTTRTVETAVPTDVATLFSPAREQDISTTVTDGTVRASYSEEYLGSLEERAEQNARESIELQIEQETGAELGEGDIEYTQTEDGQITGRLTDSGEEAVAVEKAPLGDVPVVGGITTTGARIRTRGRNFFEPASDFYTENITNPARNLIGLSAAALPLAATEPTPFGEIGVGSGVAIGGGALAVGIGSGYVGNIVLGEQIEAQAQDTPPTRETLQQAATAELGEIPTPTRPASEPFPTDAPAPTREIGEIFPTGGAPTDTTEPFAPEQQAPTEPSEPFGPEQDAPTEAPEGVAPESPPIDPEVGETVGGPAGFSSPVGQGIVRQRPEVEEDDDGPTIIGEENPIPSYPFDPTSGIGRRGARQIGQTPPSGISRRYRRAQEPEAVIGEEGPGRTIEGQRVQVWPGDSPGAAQDVWQDFLQDMRLGQGNGLAVEQRPLSMDVVGPDTDVLSVAIPRQDQAQEPALTQQPAQTQRPDQAQLPEQAQEPAEETVPENLVSEGYGFGPGPGPGYANPPEYAFPEEPAYPAGYGYGYPPTTTRRRPRLPEGPDADDDEFGFAYEEEVGGIYADFLDPLTGGVLETQRDSRSGDQIVDELLGGS